MITPNKWSIDPHDRAVVVDDKGNDIACCSIPAKRVRAMDDCEWAYSNARLIAAAPQTKKNHDLLLEACHNAVGAYDILKILSADKQLPGFERCLDFLNHAIAAAEETK